MSAKNPAPGSGSNPPPAIKTSIDAERDAQTVKELEILETLEYGFSCQVETELQRVDSKLLYEILRNLLEMNRGLIGIIRRHILNG